ncbi:fibrillin-3-like [Hermetia illucens]|uniref:fibrillin-3-like n=1 Tax=Hermetia illucens TaxID=343691 RepID=UPI0018CC1C14|nr:fibrillin-3-like [Hermetia illucens]
MHMACPEGQYFSKSLVQCVDDDGSCKDVKGTFIAADKASCGQYRNGESVKNPHDCQSYVICTNGEMISQKCPEGEYFNENTKTCLPDNGVCVPKEPNPTNCGNFADGEFVEDLANCVNFFSCVRGEMKKLSCSDGQYYNKDKQECVNDDGTCSDVIPTKPEKLQLSSTSCGTHRSGEAWPDEEDCQVFFICYNGETVRQTCDTGLYFDAVAKTCVASKARCACPPVPQPPTSCDCGNYTNGEFWVDDENCARFFVCVEGRIRSLSCPDGQFFSKKHRRCFPDDGTCEDVVPLPPETGCCDGSSNGKQIPDPDDCYKYYVCCNSEWVSQSCKDGLYFNATVGCCLPGSCNNVKPSDCGDIKDGQSVPGVDCKDYSVCRNGTLINETCQDGYYFNNETLQCVVDNGECRTTTTTTTTETPGPLDCGDIKDGEVIPGEDCKDYSVCRNGTLINETCQDGYYFNSETLECVVDNGECRTTTTTTTTEIPGPLDCGDIKDGEVVPGEDCKDYSVCVNGTLINETCQDGYYFNSGTLECVVDNGECRTTTTTTTTEIPGPLNCGDIKDGEVVPGEDCKDYSVCRNGTLISETCQDGYYFNSGTLECVVDNGECRTTTTTTTTETPGPLDCGDIKDGELVPGIDCKDYSVCVNGTLINETCEDGYYFNSETLQCIVDNGECRTTTTTTTTEIPGRDCGEIGNGQKAPHPDNCTLYLLCEDGDLITHECENVIESETEVGVCICRPPVITPTPRPCGEHEDGSFSPDETDCTAFRLCCNGEFVTISCPEGYHYDQDLEICVIGDCTSQTTTTPVPELAKCGIYESGSFIANETDCEAYSICCDGRLINKTCPPGYHFEKDSGTCEIGLCKPLKCGEYEDGELIPSEDCQDYGICVNGTIINHTCPDGYYFNSDNRKCEVDNGICRTTTTTTTTEIPGDCEDGTPNGEMKPNPDNCTTYFICENSQLVIRPCENSTETDPESGICKCSILPKPCEDVENGAFVPLVGDCAKFQMCCDGDLIVISCPEGTYFNSDLEICTPDNGECKGEPTTTTTTAPLDNCGEYPSGSFVPLEDCKKYAICCDGKLINQTCPNGYYFNKDTSICTPDDGTCEKPTPQCTEGDLEGDRDSCFNYMECVGGEWVSKECEQGTYFNPSNKQCDVNYGQCVENCECDGLLNGEMGEDPGSCSRYKLCCNCKLLVLYCQYGYYFNSEAKDCVLDVNGTCPLPTLSPADPSCGNYPNGTFIQNLNDCRGYYLCLNGRTISGSCGDNEYFDTHEGTCKVGNCPTDVTEAPVTESVICSPECYGTYVADPTDCSNYYICYFSIPVRQTCPDGQYFDTANRVCSADRGQCKLTARDISPVCHGQHGTLVSHPTDCKRFYICVNGETIPYQCKSDEFFNDKTLKCETDSKGLCNPNDLLEQGLLVNCTGLSDGTLLRNLQDCSAFYVCSSGYPVPGQCPPGFSFENEELICVRDNGKCEKSQTDVSKMARSFPINLCEGQHGVLEADSKDCSKFYTCAYGKVLSHEKCNEGEYFDQLTRQCAKNTGHCISKLDMPSNLCSDKIEGAYIPDEKDCTKFLMCTRGYAIPQKCAKDMFFDPVHKYCRQNDGTCTKGLKEAKEDASGNLCYKKHGVFVAGDQCNRYELCINEQSVAKHQCKPGLYFDGKTGKCVTDDEGICNTKDIRARSAPLPNCHRLSSKIFYANAADKCHSFFKCESGAAHTYVCPKGLIFNTVLQQCDYPEFTECVDNAVPLEDITCVGKLTGVRYVNVENGCQSYYLCVNGKDVEKSCPKGMLYNSKLDVCDWPQNVQCQGPYGKVQSRHGASAKKKGIDNSVCNGLELDKFYGNGADFCLSFFKCTGNTVHLFTCPPGLIFNSTTGACDYTHSTKCYDHKGQRVGNPPCKGDATGTLVENVQTRCQSFYICNNNEAVEQFCQDGMLFNAETKVCDWAYNVRCGVVQSHRSKRSASNEKPKHTPNCHNLKQNRYFGIAEDNCHSFFKCVGLHAMVQSCPPGLSFNSLKDECDWPHVGECFDSRGLAVRQPPCLGAETGTFAENLEDGCKSFFICNNNVAIEQRCQDGMLFNAEKNVCDWPQNVRCGIGHAHRQKRHVEVKKPKILPSCSNVEENKLYGLKDDNCRTFFRCIDNQAFTYECPSGLIFNQLTNECDWPQTSECRNVTKRVPPPPCVGVKDNTLVENLNTSCRSFFICEYSHPVEKFCQEGMLFNIKTLACDWPENVKCGAHLIHRERRDVDTPDCFNIKQNKFYGITKDGCQTFFKCLENKPFVYDCPPELIFNTEKGECDYPEATKCEGPEVDEIKEPVNPCLGKASGTFVVNFDNDCKSFFVCDNDKPLEKFCEDGMLFNAESQVCDWPEKVRCIENEHGRRQKRATAVGNPKILPVSFLSKLHLVSVTPAKLTKFQNIPELPKSRKQQILWSS